ncbi:polyamine oxidase [Pichia kluyveri]|uniref:Amine oxidase n=1 Tax=Pichia kluyveri TaxID=36015 RepID=A0AAV5QZL2_PICKL|nr:polyamine oxidase [Pichia kluyveri]
MEHYKTVIIGAGISGLAAAESLHEKNVDYAIFEARDRVGGRIQTDRTGLAPYDLGASWAHDTLTNPLFDTILDKIDVEEKDEYNLYYDDQRPLYFSDIKGPKFFENNKIEQVMHELEKFVELKYFEEIDKEDVPLRDIIHEYISKQKRLLTKEQVLYAPQLARHLELWHGIGWDEMSSKFGLVDNVGRNCLFRNGYDIVINNIVSKLDSNRIFLNSIVKKIDRTKLPIKVEFTNGKVVTCDWIICTVPQSILQLKVPEIGSIEWNPALPTRIQDALSNMSWGKLGKIIFEFEEPWWKHFDTDRFVALAKPDDADKVNDGLPKPWDFPVLVLNLYKIFNVPALLCFTQGKLTEYLERNPDKAWSYMSPILSRLINKDLDEPNDIEQVNPPTNTIVSQWTVDPFSRGSYAACNPNNDPTDLVIQLEKGIQNVRFAGEHTILDGAGAVHGAWMSGRREADHILIKENIIEGTLDEW